MRTRDGTLCMYSFRPEVTDTFWGGGHECIPKVYVAKVLYPRYVHTVNPGYNDFRIPLGPVYQENEYSRLC